MPEEADALNGLLSELGGYGPAAGGGNGGAVRAEPYPTAKGGLNSRGFALNPGAPQCSFYMKTGQCRFGATCRFDHPEAGGGGTGEFNTAGYPLNPGEQDCTFFMKTGQCKFGLTCRFNHPEGMATVTAADAQVPHGSLPGQGAPQGGPKDCAFFMKTGNCKFGATCKFNHREGVAASVAGDNGAVAAAAGGDQSMMNSQGYPLNPGTQDCMFYMKTGQCKFGATCRYNHPEMSAEATAAAPDAAAETDELAMELMSTDPDGNSTGNPSVPDCNFYMKTGSCKFGANCRFKHSEGIAQQSLNSAGYPLNPDQPDCGFFTKTGTCKFGATCKWNHPEGLATAMAGDSQGQQAVLQATKAAADAEVNSAGYPLHPEQADCTFYMKTGQCKFGATCRYNHPEGMASVSATDSGAAGGDAAEATFATIADAFAADHGAEAAGCNSQGYPLNPGAPDCTFYMKTGSCKFGGTCRFNHPEFGADGAVSSGASANGQAVNSAGYPLNPEQQDCSFYMKMGSCKFGATCRFNHPEGIAPAGATAPAGAMALGKGSAGGKGGGDGGKGAFMSCDSLNSAGYPLHPDKPDCSFYVKTGSCKFGATCRFNHPENSAAAAQAGGGAAGAADEFQAFMGSLLGDEAAMGQQQPAAGDAPVPAGDVNEGGFPMRAGVKACNFYMRTGNCKFGATCNWNHPANVQPGMDLSGMNSCGYPLNPGAGECALFMQTGMCQDGAACQNSHPELSEEGDADAAAALAALGGEEAQHPSRPGQPTCGFYMKTGTCKFGPMCRFDHPAGAGGSGAPAAAAGDAQLNSSGYPLRPGSTPCAFYMKTGQCKFGLTCKNDHPELNGAPAAAANAQLNSSGYPLRPGSTPCAFYMKTGQCKFGQTCKNDHPEQNGGGHWGGGGDAGRVASKASWS